MPTISEKEAQCKYSVKKHYNFKDYIEGGKKKLPIKSAPCVQFCLVCNYLKNIKVIKQYHDTDNISEVYHRDIIYYNIDT